MKRTRKRRRRLKKGVYIFLILSILCIAGGIWFVKGRKELEENIKNKENKISSYFNKYVITTKETPIYKLKGGKYQKYGTVGKDIELSLKKTKIDSKTKYFKVSSFDEEYYIPYNNLKKIDELSTYSQRYKEYIPFNEDIETKESTSFYDEDNNLVYSFNKSFKLPIIIKDDEKYGVEFNERLLYVKAEDVKKTTEAHNTDKKNASHIGALNYHFFWDDATESPSDCNQIICHSKSSFKKQLDLIKEMNLLTLKMDEVEKYIDGKIRIPNGVVITIDDGYRAGTGIETLNEYKMYATIFLITGSYDPAWVKTEDNKYVEVHSHTDKLHDGGKCPGGQGGGLKCLPEETILNDLKTSREKLGGSTVLCYPFYEYNDYTIKLVKQAGFTMAFAGEGSGDNHIKVGSNKYALPRFVIVTSTSMYELKSYLS